jgi:inner membrane transporter RhtA
VRLTPSLVPIALLLLAMASFQAGASIAKTMFPVAGAVGMVTVRIVLGTAILALTLRPWRARIAPESRSALIIYGISLGLMNLCFYSSISRIPLGVAVALEFSGPLAVAVLTSRRALDFCWVLLAVAGLVLLLPIGQLDNRIDPIGILYALAAGFWWGLYIIYGRRAGADHGTQTVALGSVISTIIVAPIGLATAGARLFTRSLLLPGLAVAVLSTALPYTLEMIALTRIPARTYGILASADPALAALFGLLYLNERLSGLQWTAIALIIAASIGTTASTSKVPMPG